jgi:hypothetical protein
VLSKNRLDRKNPPCPRKEAFPDEHEADSKPVAMLAAPSIGRGAAPETSIRLDGMSNTKKVDLAMRIASEDNGGANFETKSRPGEAIAMPVRTAEGVSLAGSWGNQGGGTIRAPLDYGTATGAAAQDGFRARNSNILDALARDRQPKLKPVYRGQK